MVLSHPGHLKVERLIEGNCDLEVVLPPLIQKASSVLKRG